MTKTIPTIQQLVIRYTVSTLLAILAGYLVVIWDLTRSTIAHGFDRKLLAISTASAAFVPGAIHEELITLARTVDEENRAEAETTAAYRALQEPMIRILRDSELTYHYTTIVQSESEIMYGIDATTGADHSPLGSIEENPHDEMARLQQVLANNRTSISGIQPFDRWGLLKIGSAPIRNSSGDVVALMGADVNVTVIDARTRVILVQLLIIFGLTLVLISQRVPRISRTASRSLRMLRDEAYELAAGALLPDRDERIGEYETVRLALQERAQVVNNTAGGSHDPAVARAAISLLHHVAPETDQETALLEAIQEMSALGQRLPRLVLQRLLRQSERRTFTQTTVIASKASPYPLSLIVIDGSVNGNTQGSWIGVRSALTGEPLTHDLTADAEGATVLCIDRPVLLELFEEIPELSVLLLNEAHLSEGHK